MFFHRKLIAYLKNMFPWVQVNNVWWTKSNSIAHWTTDSLQSITVVKKKLVRNVFKSWICTCIKLKYSLEISRNNNTFHNNSIRYWLKQLPHLFYLFPGLHVRNLWTLLHSHPTTWWQMVQTSCRANKQTQKQDSKLISHVIRKVKQQRWVKLGTYAGYSGTCFWKVGSSLQYSL